RGWAARAAPDPPRAAVLPDPALAAAGGGWRLGAALGAGARGEPLEVTSPSPAAAGSWKILRSPVGRGAGASTSSGSVGTADPRSVPFTSIAARCAGPVI